MDVYDNINVFVYGFAYLLFFFKLIYLQEGLRCAILKMVKGKVLKVSNLLCYC